MISGFRSRSGYDSSSSDDNDLSDESGAADEAQRARSKPAFKGRWTKEEVSHDLFMSSVFVFVYRHVLYIFFLQAWYDIDFATLI